ncbi:MAG: hypothetical protein U0T81_14260 [Saprospiraceae bacterium]
MNKIFLLLVTVFAVGLTTSIAQTCSHSAKKGCCKASSTASASSDDAYMTAATSAAAKDASIEKRPCAEEGKFCFFRNTKDATGSTVSTMVVYDQSTAQFVNAKGSCETKKLVALAKKLAVQRVLRLAPKTKK